MNRPAYKLMITFDTGQGQVSGELLKDLTMIMSQYGLKPAVVNISANDDDTSISNPAMVQSTMDKDEKTHEPRILRFPFERIKRDDSDLV